jgi:hypothetical protein
MNIGSNRFAVSRKLAPVLEAMKKIIIYPLITFILNCIPYHSLYFKSDKNYEMFECWYISCRVYAFEGSGGFKKDTTNSYYFYAFADLSDNSYYAIPNKSEYSARINNMELNYNSSKYIGNNKQKDIYSDGFIDLEYSKAIKESKNDKVYIPKNVKDVKVSINCSFKNKLNNNEIDTTFVFNLIKYDKSVWGPLLD